MIKKLVLLVFAIVAINNKIVSQGIYINRVFQDTSGSPLFNPVLNQFGGQWSSTINSSSGGIITVGYTFVSGHGQDVYLIKHSSDGGIVFQTTWNSSGSNNDYGTSLYEAANGDILVCGTTDNGGLTDYDIVVLRFSSTGTFLYRDIRDGSITKRDVAVSITEDSGGQIFVAANTETSFGFSDFWVLQYNSTLALVNSNTYDYTGLNDFAIGLQIAGSGNIQLVGPSASGTATCDYVLVEFDNSSLAYISESRSSLTGTDLDQAMAFCRDAGNNTYITGRAWNGSDFDIKTLKINNTMSIAWTATLNAHGLDDCANTTDVDPVTGDVIIAGYTTKSSSVKEMICLRLAASNGSVISMYKQSSENASGDAFIKTIHTNATGDVYFIGQEKANTGFKRVIVGKIKADGTPSWQKYVDDSGQDILPSDLELSGNSIYAISILDSVAKKYITSEFDELNLDTATVSSGISKYKKNELVVRFQQSAMRDSVVNNQIGSAIREFGNLSDFLTST